MKVREQSFSTLNCSITNRKFDLRSIFYEKIVVQRVISCYIVNYTREKSSVLAHNTAISFSSVSLIMVIKTAFVSKDHILIF